jgi:hypothetical protein
VVEFPNYFINGLIRRASTKLFEVTQLRQGRNSNPSARLVAESFAVV